MNSKIKALIEKYDEQPIRLRLLFAFAGIALLGLIVDQLWIAPNFEKNRQLNDQIATVESNINDLIRTQQEMNRAVTNQKNDPNKIQIDKNKAEIAELQKALEEKTVSLVKPERMSTVLKKIFRESEKLKLISLVKLAPQDIFESKESSDADNEAEIKVFRHPFVLTLEGSFFEVQSFLEQLEGMEQKINFETLEYKVEQHPKSKVVLTVSTLSLYKEWIGG